MKTTIKELRQAGLKVKVFHSRYFAEDHVFSDGKKVRHFVLKHKGEFIFETNPYERGGKTEVVVCNEYGCYTGIAECSLNDPFNRRKGIQIALGRALNEMHFPFLKKKA